MGNCRFHLTALLYELFRSGHDISEARLIFQGSTYCIWHFTYDCTQNSLKAKCGPSLWEKCDWIHKVGWTRISHKAAVKSKQSQYYFTGTLFPIVNRDWMRSELSLFNVGLTNPAASSGIFEVNRQSSL